MHRIGPVRTGTLWISAFALVVLATVPDRPALADDAPSAAINSMCPVMTDEPVEPEITLEFHGKTIGFCCERCRKKFKANPDRYLAALPQLVGAADASAVSEVDAKKQPGGHVDGSDAEAIHQTSEHIHGSDAGAENAEEESEPLLGRLHPAIIHFPLAGVPLALLGFLVWTVTSRDAFSKADVPPLLVSALASIAAVITGNIAHDAMSFSPSMHEIVERHQFVSTAVMILTLLLTLLRLWRWNRLEGRWRSIYGGGLCLATAMLMFTGYLGGSLVFGADHLAW